jgi:hypothetical protein
MIGCRRDRAPEKLRDVYERDRQENTLYLGYSVPEKLKR